MYKKILVSMDGSKHSITGGQIALAAAHDLGARILACHIYDVRIHNRRLTEMEPMLPARYQKEEVLSQVRAAHKGLIVEGFEALSKGYMDGFLKTARDRGISVSQVHREGRNDVEILKLAQEEEVDLVLVFLAIFEFWAAMRLFGKKGSPSKHARLILRLHRIGGYLFLVFSAFISWVCVEMMDQLAEAGKQLDSRAFIHGFFTLCLFAVLLVKISFIRMYRNYRRYVPMLGITLSSGTLVLWAFAGWLFLVIL